jgi:hypothetical protein
MVTVEGLLQGSGEVAELADMIAKAAAGLRELIDVDTR